MGIDVSHWQGEIDFVKVRDAGHKFVIVKVSDGVSGVDEAAYRHIALAREAGMRIGVYHFYRYGQNPELQMAHFINSAHNAGWDFEKDIPPAIDMEDEPWRLKLAKHVIRHPVASAVVQMLASLKLATGRKPILYCDPFYCNDYIGPGFRDHCDLWIADYGSAPFLPEGFNEWAIWQKTPNGHVPGIEGDVDIDIISKSGAEVIG